MPLSLIHIFIRLLDDKMRFTDWLGDDPFRAQTELGIGVRAVADLIGRAEQEGLSLIHI